MTENKNFCVSALYDLLKDDGINLRWEGNKIHLYRPGGLSDLHKIAFRNFKGDLQPFTNIDLPTLKADVLLMSNGLKTINLFSDDTYNLPGNLSYDSSKLNKIMTINKGWSYNDNSDDGVIIDNIKELFNIVNESLNDYFTHVGLVDDIDLTDLTTWAPLRKFYDIPNRLNPTYSPLIVDSEKNIYYYASSTDDIKTFTITDDYFKGHPLEDGKNIIIGFENGDDGYYMNIYYGTAPDLTRLYHQFFSYSTNPYAVDGVSAGEGKYYQNYLIFNGGDYPLICVPYMDAGSAYYQIYVFQIKESTYTLRIDLNSQTYETLLAPLQSYIMAEELEEMYLLGFSTQTGHSFIHTLLKLKHNNETYYEFNIFGISATYGDNISIIITSYFQTYAGYNASSPNMFNNFGTNGAFNGYLSKIIYSGGYQTSLRLNIPGIGFYYIHNSDPLISSFTREIGYYSNIVDGYYEDSTHLLGYFTKSGGTEKFYKAVDDSFYTAENSTTSATVDGQYYDIDKHYGQFLNGGPILFYNNEVLNENVEPNGVRIATTDKSDVICTAKDTNNNTVYLNPRYDDYLNFTFSYNPFNLISITDEGSEISGAADIPEIYFSNDYKANIIMRVYTEPYYFELITKLKYDENTTQYNMRNVLTDLIYRASNDNILKTLEYLILIRYNNNNVILKCSNFPNNDGSVFNINDESRINFKTMITDNTQQEITITLEGNDGTAISYDLLKEIYAHCSVSVDWIQ